MFITVRDSSSRSWLQRGSRERAAICRGSNARSILRTLTMSTSKGQRYALHAVFTRPRAVSYGGCRGVAEPFRL
eukprot:scaffold269390_cov39-Tisochrysis_lutea.AAC.2